MSSTTFCSRRVPTESGVSIRRDPSRRFALVCGSTHATPSVTSSTGPAFRVRSVAIHGSALEQGLQRLLLVDHRAARMAVLMLCCMLVACESTTTPSSTIGAAGGVVFGPGGVALGVPAGTIGADVTVVLEVVAPPASPIPADLVAHGDVYRASSSTRVDVKDLFGGLIVGVPVPGGLQPSRLRAALLVPGGEESRAEDWSILPGFYDAPRKLLLARLYGLTPAGATLQLVEDTAPATLRTPSTARVIRTLAAAVGDPWPVGFEVLEVSPQPLPGAKAFFEAQLNLALERYKAAGFAPFDIQTAESGLSLDPPSVAIPSSPLYRVTLQGLHAAGPGTGFLRVCETGGGASVNGEYRAASKELVLCAQATAGAMQDPANVAAMIGTTFHELFHSIQAVHLGQPPPETARYFKEATAVLAGVWGPQVNDTVVRDAARDLRLVDEPLLQITGQAPYNAQDFWEALAQTSHLTFPALMQAFLVKGDVSPAKVDEVLSGSPFGSTLPKEYRGWVRSQAADPTTCIRAVGSSLVVGQVDITEGGATGIPPVQSLQVPPLATRVLELGITNSTSGPVGFLLMFSGDWGAPTPDGGSPVVITELQTDSAINITCTTLPDGPLPLRNGSATHRVAVAPGGTTTVFVLGVNGNHDRDLTGQISFSREAANPVTVSLAVPGTLSGPTPITVHVVDSLTNAPVAGATVTFDVVGGSIGGGGATNVNGQLSATLTPIFGVPNVRVRADVVTASGQTGSAAAVASVVLPTSWTGTIQVSRSSGSAFRIVAPPDSSIGFLGSTETWMSELNLSATLQVSVSNLTPGQRAELAIASVGGSGSIRTDQLTVGEQLENFGTFQECDVITRVGESVNAPGMTRFFARGLGLTLNADGSYVLHGPGAGAAVSADGPATVHSFRIRSLAPGEIRPICSATAGGDDFTFTDIRPQGIGGTAAMDFRGTITAAEISGTANETTDGSDPVTGLIDTQTVDVAWTLRPVR